MRLSGGEAVAEVDRGPRRRHGLTLARVCPRRRQGAAGVVREAGFCFRRRLLVLGTATAGGSDGVPAVEGEEGGRGVAVGVSRRGSSSNTSASALLVGAGQGRRITRSRLVCGRAEEARAAVMAAAAGVAVAGGVRPEGSARGRGAGAEAERGSRGERPREAAAWSASGVGNGAEGVASGRRSLARCR